MVEVAWIIIRWQLFVKSLERGDTAFRTAVSVHIGLNSLTILQWGTKNRSKNI